jgi:hypothetical protein
MSYSTVALNGVDRLAEWLSVASDRDVLMFCRDKKPIYRHAGDAWAWQDFRSMFSQVSCKKGPDSIDFGILLHDLCVIDIDHHALVADFEERFPILKSAPKETTAKGAHYYFLRSELADQHGYYDSHSAVTQGIDFKTRCANGTRGLVICAPSKNKEWVLAPWNTVLRQIPDDLLRRVATPSIQPHSVDLVFEGGDMLQLRNNKWLAKMDLFANLLDLDAMGIGIIQKTNEIMQLPIMTDQFKKQSFEDLFEILENRVPSRLFTKLSQLQHIQDLAKYVGLSHGLYDRLLKETSPTCFYTTMMDLTAYDADLVRMVYEKRERGLVDLQDADVVKDMYYKNPRGHGEHNNRDKFLLYKHRGPGIAEGAHVLHDNGINLAETVWDQMPNMVRYMLGSYPNQVGITGGSVVASCSPHVTFTDDADYDLVVFNATPDQANDIAWDLLSQPSVEVSALTGNAITVMVASEEDGAECIKIQLILKVFSGMQELFDSFDIDACKICLCVKSSTEFELKAAEEWIVAMRHMTVWMDLRRWSKSSVYRFYKYYTKGFDVFVPGLQRKAFVRMSRYLSWVQNPVSTRPGIFNVFAIEKYLVDNAESIWNGLRSPSSSLLPRPKYAEVLRAIRKMCYRGYNAKSNYDNEIMLYSASSMLYALKTMLQKGWDRVFGSKNKEALPNRNASKVASLNDVDSAQELKKWIAWCHTSRPLGATISPRLSLLYNKS